MFFIPSFSSPLNFLEKSLFHSVCSSHTFSHPLPLFLFHLIQFAFTLKLNLSITPLPAFRIPSKIRIYLLLSLYQVSNQSLFISTFPVSMFIIHCIYYENMMSFMLLFSNSRVPLFLMLSILVHIVKEGFPEKMNKSTKNGRRKENEEESSWFSLILGFSQDVYFSREFPFS